MKKPNEIKDISAIKIPMSVQMGMTILEDAGEEAFIVGGCVRDTLLGKEPHDWDLTTSAKPENVMAIFKAAGIKTLPIGIAHGTVTALIKGNAVEITTYREDGTYSDGRHPDSVTFSGRLEDDLCRRDFTINAMAYNMRQGLVDLYGGVADLRAGIIRAVGEPRKRFEEDALRIMRAVRFSAQLGFSIESATRKALVTCRRGLSQIAAERITAELLKTLTAPHADNALLAMQKRGITAVILPQLSPAPENQGKRLLHGLPTGEEVRLAAWLRPYGIEIAEEALGELVLSKYVRRRTLILLKGEPFPAVPKPVFARRILQRYGDLATDACALYAADRKGWEKLIENEKKRRPALSIIDLNIKGTDLQKAGVPFGRQMGDVLTYLLEKTIKNPNNNEKGKLLSLAAEYIKKNPDPDAEPTQAEEKGKKTKKSKTNPEAEADSEDKTEAETETETDGEGKEEDKTAGEGETKGKKTRKSKTNGETKEKTKTQAKTKNKANPNAKTEADGEDKGKAAGEGKEEDKTAGEGETKGKKTRKSKTNGETKEKTKTQAKANKDSSKANKGSSKANKDKPEDVGDGKEEKNEV